MSKPRIVLHDNDNSHTLTLEAAEGNLSEDIVLVVPVKNGTIITSEEVSQKINALKTDSNEKVANAQRLDGKSADNFALADMSNVNTLPQSVVNQLEGAPGDNGDDGVTPHIGVNGNWYIGDVDTGVLAEGVDGAPGPQGPEGPEGPQGPAGENSDATGAVGTYGFFYDNSAGNRGAGSTLAGSNLRYAGVQYYNTNNVQSSHSGTPGGTWKCMGYSPRTAQSHQDSTSYYGGVTLWKRIS